MDQGDIEFQPISEEDLEKWYEQEEQIEEELEEELLARGYYPEEWLMESPLEEFLEEEGIEYEHTLYKQK